VAQRITSLLPELDLHAVATTGDVMSSVAKLLE
jgi:hypothetical protein